MPHWEEIAKEIRHRNAPSEITGGSELREFAPEVARKEDKELLEEIQVQLHASRKLFSAVCLELATVLGYPRAPLKPYRVGYVGAGPASWAAYLKFAPLTELKHVICPYLHEMALQEELFGFADLGPAPDQLRQYKSTPKEMENRNDI